jgi:uncharacterized protein
VLKILKAAAIFLVAWQLIPRLAGFVLRSMDIEYDLIIANELCILVGSLFFISFNRDKDYGINIKTESTLRIVLLTLLLQSCVILSFFFLIISKSSLPDFITHSSFLLVFLKFIVLAAISEEIFMRGLIQTELDFFQGSIRLRAIQLTTPVIVTAFLFGAMHLFPLGSKGMLNFMTAFILGLIAGYYREKSGSLFPALIAHASYNFWGGIPAKLMYIAFG